MPAAAATAAADDDAGLIPQLAARQLQEGGGSSGSSGSGGSGAGPVLSMIAPDMSDIRTHTKAHLRGLAK